MLRKENNLWWGKNRRWLIHSLVWLFVVNGFLAFSLWGVPALVNSEWLRNTQVGEEIAREQTEEAEEEEGESPIETFIQIMEITTFIGVIIITQGIIIGEKQSGTAEWIFSNPVSRSAFILSKFIANTIGVLVTIIVVQGIVSYLLLGAYMGFLPILSYLGAMGLLSLRLMFYLSLTLMLGVFFNTRSLVLGLAFGVFIGQFFAGGFLSTILPKFTEMFPENLIAQATQLLNGEPVTSLSAIITTTLCLIIFIVAALVRFNSQELV
jgi:ABC-2 type transport system permease protein